MDLLSSLYTNTLFRLATLTWLEGLDLLLVTLTFYLLLSFVRRSRAAFLVRGVLILSIVLFIFIILLPLPAFNWLMLGVFVAILVAMPIIFQPELRHLLERLGRTTGLGRAVRQTAAEHMLAALLHAVENMSTPHIGALIVLEGQTSLQEVIETGIAVEGRVSSELLQAIFYPENPLHDGAVVLREDRLVAASCVLPLTHGPLPTRRRLGTRHRAAIGLSEISDALVVVISEETGTISVARAGQLRRPLDSTTLRQELFDFYNPAIAIPSGLSLRRLLSQLGQQFWSKSPLPAPQRLLSNLSLFLISLVLAVEMWAFIAGQTNPAREIPLNNIPLQVEDIPPGTTLVNSLPAVVEAVIRTTAEIERSLSSERLQAFVSLEGLSPGRHVVPVQINTGPQLRLQVLSVQPDTLELELAPIISQTHEVTIDVPNQQSLSPAYLLVSPPAALPALVQVVGPASLVEQVDQVRATISLAGATGLVQETRPVRAVDERGREVTGVSLQPDQVRVSAVVRRREDARTVGVRVEVTGTPPPGYQLSGWSVSPNSITVQGEPEQLDQMGSFVETAPIDVSQVIGDLIGEIPLNLPPGIQALDRNGNTINTVTATVRATATSDSLTVTRPVELLGVAPGMTVTVNPPRVYLRLNGPSPILNQIKAEPDLVKVLVDGVGLASGQSTILTPTLVVPSGVQAELVPSSVVVTLP